MKAGSNGTTKIRKMTTWPVENFLTGDIAKTLSCIFVADQMGQRTHLSNCPCAYCSFCWNTPTNARLLWVCASSKSGCSGIVKTKKTKTTGLENYRNLCLQKTSNSFSVTISKSVSSKGLHSYETRALGFRRSLYMAWTSELVSERKNVF